MAIYLTLAPMGGNLEGVRAASLAYFGKEPGSSAPPRPPCWSPSRNRRAPPARPLRRRRADRPRPRAGARAGGRRDRPRAVRHGDEPPGADAAPRHADERAASRGLARRPVARRGRADHDPPAARSRASSQLVADERGQMADKAQIAMVVIDNRTGGVVAWLGGGDFFGRAGQVDLVRAHRSPGSALKPMIYALAFDDRTLHPESLVEDVPVRFKDWLPRNFDRDHQGAVTVRRALQQSLNVPAVLALERVGPARFLSTLRAAGATPILPPGDPGTSLGMALGSATISPLEMAGPLFGPRQWRPLRPAAGAPRPAAARAGAARRRGRGLVRRRHPGRCAAARRLRLAAGRRCASGASPTRPAPRPASATPGPRATAPTGRSWSGSAMPTARRGRASSAALAALPILFKAFGRLPGEDNRAPRPPADVMRVASWKELPLRMRTLGADRQVERRAAHRLSAARCAARARRARGGDARRQRQRHAALAGRRPAARRAAAGRPTARARRGVAVVDDTGRSSAVTVRIVRRP